MKSGHDLQDLREIRRNARRVTVRVRPEDRAWLKSAAAAAGCTPGELLARTLRAAKASPPPPRKGPLNVAWRLILPTELDAAFLRGYLGALGRRGTDAAVQLVQQCVGCDA